MTQGQSNIDYEVCIDRLIERVKAEPVVAASAADILRRNPLERDQPLAIKNGKERGGEAVAGMVEYLGRAMLDDVFLELTGLDGSSVTFLAAASDQTQVDVETKLEARYYAGRFAPPNPESAVAISRSKRANFLRHMALLEITRRETNVETKPRELRKIS